MSHRLGPALTSGKLRQQKSVKSEVGPAYKGNFRDSCSLAPCPPPQKKKKQQERRRWEEEEGKKPASSEVAQSTKGTVKRVRYEPQNMQKARWGASCSSPEWGRQTGWPLERVGQLPYPNWDDPGQCDLV